MPNPLSPCKGCSERFVGCHSNCEKYKEFTQENDEIRKKRQSHYFYDDYAIKKTQSFRKFRQKHKQ